MTDNLYDKLATELQKAQIEAEKQGIRANAIILNEKYHYIREHIIYGNALAPPMLCGMRVVLDTLGELPEEYGFAIVDSNPVPQPVTRADVLDELKKLTVDELISTVYGVDLHSESFDLDEY